MDSELDLIFRALGDPTRRRILGLLGERELSVLEIAKPFKISLPGISKHLKVLENAKLISRTVEGRVHRFALNPAKLKTAQEWLIFHQSYWSKNLNQLKSLLEEK